MYEGRKRTPLPIREREEKTRGAGPVITYKLTPEELKVYRATGEWIREDETMNSLTKEQYLQLRLKGKKRSEIMKEYFSSNAAFYRYLRDWGIQNRSSEERELEHLRSTREISIDSGDTEAETVNEKPLASNAHKTAQPKRNVHEVLNELLEGFGVTDAIRAVIDERQRQENKWGEQNHEPQFWTSILGEEFGELCEAINETVFDNGPGARRKGGYENMRREAVQVAAVAVGFIEALDRRYRQA